MKNTTKRKYMLLVLSGLILSTIFLPLASSMNNGNAGFKERTPKDYHFRNNIDVSTYGSHDYVADSAVRLIAANPSYKDLVTRWLFDPSLSIPFYLFTRIVDAKGQFLRSKTADYMSRSTYASKGLTEEQWLYARRYIYFLHGTVIPDDTSIMPVYVNDGEVGAEYQEKESAGKDLFPLVWSWGVLSGEKDYKAQIRPHGAYYYADSTTHRLLNYHYDGTIDVNDLVGWNTENTVLAAADALIFLNAAMPRKETYFDDISLTPQVRIIKNGVHGKYEGAALCLGGMSHFIADLAVPMHTWLVPGISPNYHRQWENAIALSTKWAQSSSGIPDWSYYDPNGFMNKRNLELIPINPVEASNKMGYISFGAIDMPNQGLFDYVPGGGRHNLSTPAMIKTLQSAGSYSPLTYKWMEERMKDLVCWSIYYTACAMIFLLNKINWDEREDSRLYRNEVFLSKSSIEGCETRTVEQITLWAREAYKQVYGTNELPTTLKFVSGSMLALAPMLIVAAISLSIVLKPNIFEKNKYN